MTEERIETCYYLCDKGYDSKAIRTEIENLGKVPLIDYKKNNQGIPNGELVGNQKLRYKNRTYVESHFSRLKRNYLPSYILYQGIKKVKCFLEFALIVITGIQILKHT